MASCKQNALVLIEILCQQILGQTCPSYFWSIKFVFIKKHFWRTYEDVIRVRYQSIPSSINIIATEKAIQDSENTKRKTSRVIFSKHGSMSLNIFTR